MPLTDDDRLRLFHYMCRSRAIEDAAWALAGQGRMVGRLYTGHGQEAIPVGTAYALEAQDVVAPMYRDMGTHLVRGVEPIEIFAQYMGKRESSNAGKDSGLHLGDMARGIIGMISVLPDSVPVAVGAAMAFKIRSEPRVAMAHFGEGATSTGAFHEALNMAAVLRVPVVFVCENNRWALSTSQAREFAAPSIAERCGAYGLPAVEVDGNDVEAVYEAAWTAVSRAREGGGPSLLECHTMRMRGHSIIDPADYVPPEELEAWAARDPIDRQRERLEAAGHWDAERDAAMWAAFREEIDAAIDAAAAMADPRPEDVHTGVFAPDHGGIDHAGADSGSGVDGRVEPDAGVEARFDGTSDVDAGADATPPGS